MMNKKGQVSETMTWVIVTILLVVILLVFIYLSVALSKTKSLNANIKSGSENSVNWVNSKTQIAYSINSNNKNKIQAWIAEESTDG
jgi:hypothetical protein